MIVRAPLIRLVVLAAALVATAGSARAQVQRAAIMNMSAFVLSAPLTTTGIHALQFGFMTPGVAATILPRDAGSGEFRIAGVRGATRVRITFTLPASMTGPGGATIPLNFNGNYAALCEYDPTNNCVAGSYFAWNPVTTNPQTDKPLRYGGGKPDYTNDQLAVWIGGVATPAANQRPGNYTSTINVTLAVN